MPWGFFVEVLAAGALAAGFASGAFAVVRFAGAFALVGTFAVVRFAGVRFADVPVAGGDVDDAVSAATSTAPVSSADSGSPWPGMADLTPDTARRNPPVTQSPAPIDVSCLQPNPTVSTPWARISRVRSFRAPIRVRPAAHRDAVGGRAGASRPGDPPALEVRVRARPIDGAATAAAERVLASALGVRPRQVRVVRGATSRDKLVEITDPPVDLPARWAALLDA